MTELITRAMVPDNDMIDREIVEDAMVGILNKAFEADPGAMHALLCNVVPANQAVADMPHVVVNGLLPPFTTLGMLGVINGMLSAAGLSKIASMWSAETDEDGRSKLLGFQLCERPPTVK